jgi:hypothetical protein
MDHGKFSFNELGMISCALATELSGRLTRNSTSVCQLTWMQFARG